MQPWKKTFVTAFVAQILSIVGFSFALPFLPFFVAELGVETKAEQAWWAGIVMASAGVTLALFAPLWGALADRYGRKLMVVRSMFGGTIVLTLMSLVQTVGQLVVCRLLQGVLTGTIAASVALVASVTPPRRSGFAMGMMQAAVFLGVSLGPLFGGIVADRFGYRVAFQAGAAIVLLGGFLVHYGTREDFRPPDPDKDEGGYSFGRSLTNGAFLTAVLVLFAVRFSNTMSNPSFPLIIEEIVEDKARLNSISGVIIACAAFAGAISAAVLGHAGDRWGHRNVLIACSLGAAVSSAAHVAAFSLPHLTIARVCFGLAVAGTLPAVNAMISGVTDPRHIGKAYGGATSFSMMGLALGPLAGGYLAREAGLRMPFLATALAQLAVCVMVLVMVRAPAKLLSDDCPRHD